MPFLRFVKKRIVLFYWSIFHEEKIGRIRIVFPDS